MSCEFARHRIDVEMTSCVYWGSSRNFVIWTLFKQQQSGTSSVKTHKRIIQSDCLILEVAHVKTNVQMELNRFLTSLVSYLRFIMDQQKNLKCERLVYSVVTQPPHGLVRKLPCVYNSHVGTKMWLIANL